MAKSILILGSGYISSPLIKYFYKNDQNFCLTIASNSQNELSKLSQIYPSIKTKFCDVINDPEILGKLIENSSIVISLVFNHVHHFVIEKCIQVKRHVIMPSYNTNEIKSLENKAKEAGIIVFCEIGLDPGLDHMLAKEAIDKIHHDGGKVESFISFCGALPSPEFSTNPLRYKFSWSPRTVIKNVTNSAKYIKDERVIEIKEGGDLIENGEKVKFLPGFALEGYPNRDSTIYKDLYEIPETKQMLRGTLRYSGFLKIMKIFKNLGLLNQEKREFLEINSEIDLSWNQIICKILNISENSSIETIKLTILERNLGCESQIKSLFDLGLLDDIEKVKKRENLLDTLSVSLSEKLPFEKNERDIIIMHHEIISSWTNSGGKMLHETDFVCYGTPGGSSAMASITSLAIGTAAKLILNGKISEPGIILPIKKEVYKLILEEMSKEGVHPIEKCKLIY